MISTYEYTGARYEGSDLGQLAFAIDSNVSSDNLVVLNCDPDITNTGLNLNYGTDSLERLIPVSAGAHNIQVRADDVNGAPNNIILYRSHLNVLFIPFDASGGTVFPPLAPDSTSKAKSEKAPQSGPTVEKK